MKTVILDASALLALIRSEPGAEEVEKYAPNYLISAVNASEAAAVLQRGGMTSLNAKDSVVSLVAEIYPFTPEHAFITADLLSLTKHLGLSLGDRACLALGQALKRPILTADKAWQSLQSSYQVELIR